MTAMAKLEKSPASPTGKPAWIPALKSPCAWAKENPNNVVSATKTIFFMILNFKVTLK